ncbi:hypothetical protein [Marinomonas algicola]|uniref:hypothetical protein n=1 Tax=Marinomonas algicola TaxID=2773454 RepID=UPI00174CAE03|nr:hypothetical protein [Marinomonas algicola]
MKLSPSHGLLILSESGFRLLTYKQVKQSGSILFSNMGDNEPNQSALLSDEMRQRSFIDSVVALEKNWPERYRLDGRKIKKCALLIPVHWLVHVRENLPKIGSNYLLSLASLSLVSEKIRLAPEKLYYGYKAVDSDEEDLFDIYGCAMEWITRVADICDQIELVSVYLYDVNAVYSEKSLDTLLEIEAYKPLKWQQQKQFQLAKQCMSASLVLALIGSVSLYFLNQQQAAAVRVVENARSQFQTLAPPPSTLVGFRDLRAALLAIPLHIKVTTFEFDQQQMLLTVSGGNDRLKDLLIEWQKKWPKVEWRMRYLPDLGTLKKDKMRQYNNNQAQEVQHAIITGKVTGKAIGKETGKQASL